MSKADDGQIVRWALEQRAAVVTLDADFHAILAVTRASAPSVIRIRMQGLDGLAATNVVQRVIPEYAADLFHGSVITVKANKTTCHKLPIGGTD
jgi:predicted nuclease of predicted toxin-antitoxin system